MLVNHRIDQLSVVIIAEKLISFTGGIIASIRFVTDEGKVCARLYPRPVRPPRDRARARLTKHIVV